MAAAVGAFGQQDAARPHQHTPWSSHSPQSPPPMHGRKRRAENSLETEQRLSKRLDLLNLENGPRLYIPVGGPQASSSPSSSPQTHLPQPISPVTSHKHTRPPADDAMQVEDTPHRVYIHDLSAELSDVESDEEKPIFLSDIEKHIAKIPQHVLSGPELRPTKDNQLILYKVPSSLSVPEEQDRVRRAIVEARARVREKQASPVREIGVGGVASGLSSAPTPSSTPVPMMPLDDDPDAMDIDG